MLQMWIPDSSVGHQADALIRCGSDPFMINGTAGTGVVQPQAMVCIVPDDYGVKLGYDDMDGIKLRLQCQQPVVDQSVSAVTYTIEQKEHNTCGALLSHQRVAARGL
jgi:hypothetical protein